MGRHMSAKEGGERNTETERTTTNVRQLIKRGRKRKERQMTQARQTEKEMQDAKHTDGEGE